MESVQREPLRARSATLSRARRIDPAAIAAWLVPAVLITYLALENGGYGIVERSEVGIAVWWVVLLGTAVGALPLAGGTRTGRIAFGALAAFAAWTALSLSWTESDGRTTIELARTLTYLGAFGLALAAQGRGRWKHVLHGITFAVGLVCGIAVLSRLQPTMFPEGIQGRYLPGIEIERRLAYPLNYSSALGALGAIALPLLLAATASTRTLFAQALAAAALPVALLALYMTSSGLAVPVAALGVGAFLVLAPDRLPKLATLVVVMIGAALLIGAFEQREALDRGLATDAAQREGDELLVIGLVVCAGVALLQSAIGLAVRYGRRPAWMVVSRIQAQIATVVAVGAIVIAGVIVGGSSSVSQQVDDLGGTGAPTEQSRVDQLLDFSSSGRAEMWRSALRANASDPVKGIGPGSFEFWFARDGEAPGFVRDAHSLYLETLAELGIAGLLLVGGFILFVLILGAVRALRAPPELRLGLAAATAGCAAFALAAGVDWFWELGVLPLIFVGLAAISVAAGGSTPTARDRRKRARRKRVERVAMVAVSAAALIAIAIPLASDTSVRESQAAAASGAETNSVESARDAVAVEPYAASPRLQEALTLEAAGQLEPALVAAKAATEEEPTNWRTWLVLSRLEARNGNAPAALSAYREARTLNPRSGVLAPGTLRVAE